MEFPTQLLSQSYLVSKNVSFPYFSSQHRITHLHIMTYIPPHLEQDAEWHNLEDWSNNERSMAPDGVQNFFISSFDFWWYVSLSLDCIAIACSSILIIITYFIFELAPIATVISGTILSEASWLLRTNPWGLH